MALNNLKGFAKEVGMTYNAKKFLAYGDYKGYQAIIKYSVDQRQFIITMSVNGQSFEHQQQYFSQYLLTLSQTKPYVKFSNFDNYTISIGVQFKMNKNIANLCEVLDDVTNYCRTNGMESCCKICGCQTSLGVFSTNGQYSVMCDSCFERAQAELSMAQQAISEKKGNVIAGIVGALLGSLIGVVLWVIVYQLGYIAGIVGMVMAVCCMKGYEKFGGKLNIVGLIISLAIAIVMLYFAHNVAAALELFNELKDYYDITFFDTFKLIPELIQEEEEYRHAFFTNLGMGYFFMLIASASTVISTYKNFNLKHEMVRLG